MPLNRAWLCFSPETEFREQYLAYGTLWGIGAEGQHFGVCAEWVCEGTSRTNGSLVSWAGETWSLTHRKDYQGKMYYFQLQFKQPDVLVLMCDFKSISQVYQHSSPFSVQGSISLWPPAPTHPGICPEHPTAARLDWDLGNEEAKSNTSHCCWLSLTWNGQYDLRTGYPDHFTCRRSGCCVWSVYSGIWKSHVSSHLSVHSRFGLNNSIGVKVQCVSQVSPLLCMNTAQADPQ